ncbi:MAG: hypothetical protein ACMXYC_02585, partial [Candidatus Woesearchaeota archaeon]
MNKLLVYTLLMVSVSALAFACPTFNDTQSFVDSLDEVGTCQFEIPGFTQRLFGNEMVQLSVAPHTLFIDMQDGIVKSISTTGASTGYTITTSSCVLDAMFASEQPVGTFAYAYQQKALTVQAQGFF